MGVFNRPARSNNPFSNERNESGALSAESVRANASSDRRRRRRSDDDDEIQETVIVRRRPKGAGGAPPGDFWGGVDDLDTAIDPDLLDEGLEPPEPSDLPDPPVFNCSAEMLLLIGLAVERDLAHREVYGCTEAKHHHQDVPEWVSKYDGRGDECPALGHAFLEAQQAVMDQINRICDNCENSKCMQAMGYRTVGSARTGGPVPPSTH